MGYYATLTNFEIKEAKIRDKKEFLKEVGEKCEYGFSPDNCKIEIDADNYIKDFDFDEWHCKWYDEESFEKILSEHLEEGSISFEFQGEDGAVWGTEVFPQLVLEGSPDWRDKNAKLILEYIKNAPKETKEKVLNEYKEYWENKLNQAKENLKIIKEKTGKKVYKVVVPAEERRLVAVDWIKYCDTREEAEEVKKFIQKEMCVSEIEFNDWEDVEVIDSWDTEYFYDDVEVEIEEEVIND